MKTSSIISLLLWTVLPIWKHFISEKGQSMAFPLLFLANNKAAYSTLHLKGRKYTSPYLYGISTRATTVHVFMLATITTQHMNTESALRHEHCWTWWFRVIQPCLWWARASQETNSPAHICQDTAMQPHWASSAHQHISNLPSKQDSSFNTEQRPIRYI